MLSVVVRGDTVFAGCQDGYVKVLDLETKTLVRSLIVAEVRTVTPRSNAISPSHVTQNVDILSLSMLHSDLYTCSANGEVQVRARRHPRTIGCKTHTCMRIALVRVVQPNGFMARPLWHCSLLYRHAPQDSPVR